MKLLFLDWNQKWTFFAVDSLKTMQLRADRPLCMLFVFVNKSNHNLNTTTRLEAVGQDEWGFSFPRADLWFWTKQSHKKYISDIEIKVSGLKAEKCALSVSASLYFSAVTAGCELTAITSQIRFGSLALSSARSIWDYNSGVKVPRLTKKYVWNWAALDLTWEKIYWKDQKGRNLNPAFGKVISPFKADRLPLKHSSNTAMFC